MNPMMSHQLGMIENVQPKFETLDIQLHLGLELLIRGIFCASCRKGLNLVEVELPEQNLSVIPSYQEFGILGETGKKYR